LKVAGPFFPQGSFVMGEKTQQGGKFMLQVFRGKKSQKGFTLVELMIVVAIIGILAAIAIPQFAAYRQRAFNSSAQSDLRNFKTAMEADFADNQQYQAM